MNLQTLNLESNKTPTVYRASWICPVDRPPIQNGFVEVKQTSSANAGTHSRSLITNVGPISDYQGPNRGIIDLCDGAIIPGLINAHTHLEFSDLHLPLGQPGIEFTDWVRLIVKSRIDSNQKETGKKAAAIQKGIQQSVQAGVSAIGEIATDPFKTEHYVCESPVSILHFLEQLGSDETQLKERQSRLSSHLSEHGPKPLQVPVSQDSRQTDAPELNLVRSAFGASPHAPYSCHPKLIQQICRTAAAGNRIVAMHLAETKPERELLESTSGPFVDLLKDFGAWNPTLFGGDRSFLSTLHMLSGCRALIVHGNYLNDHELDFIAQHRETMSVVFCPRTHAFFRHGKYPIESMLKREIAIAVGTDSLASNPNLRLFEELKQVASSFPQLGAETILKLGTINGASSLGLESQLGTLTPGKSAAMGFVEQTDSDSNSPVEDWLFSPMSRCRSIV